MNERLHIEASLDDLFRRRGGRAAAALLSGPPGMGKTYIAKRFLKRHTEEATTLEGCGTPTGSPALLPMCRAIGTYDRDRLVRELDAVTHEYVENLPVLSQFLGPALRARKQLKMGFGMDAQATPSETYTFLVLERVLKELGARRPLILFLDDVQWLDESSIAFVAQLLQDLDRQNLFLLMTSRANGVQPSATAPIRELLERQAPESVLQLRMAPLSAEEIGLAVGRLLGGPFEGTPDQLDWLCWRSKGNPRYLREIVITLQGRGAFGRRGGQWTANFENYERLLPPSFVSSVNERLDDAIGNDEALEELVEVAAACGTEFSARRVALATGGETRRIAAALDRLGKKTGLIERDATRAVFRFDHDLTREAVLERVPGTLGELHEKIAEACEQERAPAAEVAYHLREAGLPGRAATRYLDASREAYGNWALHEATRCAAEAVLLVAKQQTEDGAPSYEDALAAQTECLLAGERYEEVLDLLRPAIDARRPVDVPRLACLFGAAAARHTEASVHTSGLAIARAAARSPLLSTDHALRADLAAVLVYLYEAVGDHQAARSWFLTGVDAAEKCTSARRRCRAWRLANIFWQPGRVIKVLEGALRLAERERLLWDQALILNNIGTANFALGDLDKARERFSASTHALRRCGGYRIDTPLNNLAIVDLAEGDTEGALSALSEAAASSRDRLAQLFIRTNQAVAAAEGGDLISSERALRELASESTRGGDVYYEDCIRHNLAVVLLRQQRPLDAINEATACPPRTVTTDDELVLAKRASLLLRAYSLANETPPTELTVNARVLDVTTKAQAWLYRLEWQLCDIEFWED